MEISSQNQMDILERMKSFYNQQIGVFKKHKEDKIERENEIVALKEEKATIEIQKILLKDASAEARKSAKDVLESMATSALQSIVGDYMSLKIILDEESNPPVAEFLVESRYTDYVVEADPAEEEGGGIADVVSMALLIGMRQLGGKNNVAPMFLDEPSKYVSKGHSENVAKFLYEASSYFKTQTFMVTHDELLGKMGDKAYHFIAKEGKTEVTII